MNKQYMTRNDHYLLIIFGKETKKTLTLQTLNGWNSLSQKVDICEMTRTEQENKVHN